MSFFWQLLVLGLFTVYFFVVDNTGERFLTKLNQQVGQGQPKANDLPPAQMMKNILLTEYQATDKGQKEWVLNAASAFSDSFDKQWDVQDAHVRLFQNNIELVEIQSGKGVVNTQTRNMHLSSNILGKTQSGYTFKTENLEYKSKEEAFISETPIFFQAPGQQTRLKGSSMRGLLKDKVMEITGPIECRQKIEGYNLAVIRSAEATISLNQREVVFNKDLFIQMDDINISGQRAEFIYSESGKTLESLIITGKVFVSSGERSAASERLEIRLNEDLFLFQGSPRFVSGENVLVGNEIVLYDKGRKVQILKGQVKSKASKEMLEK